MCGCAISTAPIVWSLWKGSSMWIQLKSYQITPLNALRLGVYCSSERRWRPMMAVDRLPLSLSNSCPKEKHPSHVEWHQSSLCRMTMMRWIVCRAVMLMIEDQNRVILVHYRSRAGNRLHNWIQLWEVVICPGCRTRELLNGDKRLRLVNTYIIDYEEWFAFLRCICSEPIFEINAELARVATWIRIITKAVEPCEKRIFQLV